MKIALLGFGGMGKAVRAIALERGHEVPVIVDPGAVEGALQAGGMAGVNRGENRPVDQVRVEGTFKKLSSDAPIGAGPGILSGIDVVIDFSHGDAVMDNLRICQEAGVNLVEGATGWYGKLEEVKKMVLGIADMPGGVVLSGAHNGRRNLPAVGFLWSSNFSIGVNMYFKIIEAAAKLINKFDEYDVWGHEIHHCNKADSPSGTAKTLEKILLENISRKKSVVEDKLDRKREQDEIHFSSVRGGLVNFGHTIGFDSAADRILITHEARCRDGYALGAVKAAEWLVGKKGYFEMEDFLNGVLGDK